MFSLDELQKQIDAYVEHGGSFDAFADWYRRASRGKFGAPKQVLDVCLKVDMALSVFDFDGGSESALRQELAVAIRPFAPLVAVRLPNFDSLREYERSDRFETRSSVDVVPRKAAATAGSSLGSRSTFVPEPGRLSATA